jgi:hypothetical protein
MPRPRLTVGFGSKVEDVAAAVTEIQALSIRGWSAGEPDPGIRTIRLARGTYGLVTRPAQKFAPADNLDGSWCEVTLDQQADLGYSQNLRVYHGLGHSSPPNNPGRNQVLNVRWTLMGVRYNTDAAAPAACGPPDGRVTFGYVDGVVESDWIELRAWSNFELGGANNGALVVTLMFWPVAQ